MNPFAMPDAILAAEGKLSLTFSMILSRIPSLNWLRVFETAARTESFARAAEQLNMSAPAVSQQIRALEQYLGRPLFTRGAQSVRLTEAGRAFLPTVTNALISLETTTASLFGRSDATPLTIRVSLMLAVSWLGPRLPAFQALHPEVQPTLLTGNALEDFQRRPSDLMVTFGTGPGPGQVGDALFGERLYPIAPQAIADRIETLADLASHRLIEVSTHRSNWLRLLPDAGALGARPEFVFTDNTLAALALCAAGGGIALARAPASDGLMDLHSLVPCLPDCIVKGDQGYHLVFPAHRSLTKAESAFRDWLLAEAAQE
ncbi:MAG: LysR family transcriptional regulator [Pseudomonadota bacterium]